MCMCRSSSSGFPSSSRPFPLHMLRSTGPGSCTLAAYLLLPLSCSHHPSANSTAYLLLPPHTHPPVPVFSYHRSPAPPPTCSCHHCTLLSSEASSRLDFPQTLNMQD